MEKNSSIIKNEVNVGTISLQISQEFSLVGRGGPVLQHMLSFPHQEFSVGI